MASPEAKPYAPVTPDMLHDRMSLLLDNYGTTSRLKNEEVRGQYDEKYMAVPLSSSLLGKEPDFVVFITGARKKSPYNEHPWQIDFKTIRDINDLKEDANNFNGRPMHFTESLRFVEWQSEGIIAVDQRKNSPERKAVTLQRLRGVEEMVARVEEYLRIREQTTTQPTP